MISIVILTKNEETDLPKCLASIAWCDDIHIVDSGSTDKTLQIAKDADVNMIINDFKSFGQQRNFAIDTINFKHEWLLFLDADERSTPAFYQTIINTIKTAKENVAGYYCCWKMILEDVWLKRCDNFPKWQFRLLKLGRARFTDYGHGQKEGEVNGSIEYISEPYLHYGFSKGWAHWLDRHNRYSTLEAQERLYNVPPLKDIFSQHGSIRMKALKAWLIKLPGWPVIRFCQSYFFKMGFLERKSGFIYCVNISYYEFLIKIKMDEIKKKRITAFKR